MRYDYGFNRRLSREDFSDPFAANLEGVARVRAHLKEPVLWGVGDHDTVQMVPGGSDGTTDETQRMRG